MLSGDQIRERGLILNENPNSYRAASYDLTVGRVIAPDQPELRAGEPVTIPPQGMVEVISAERIKLPPEVAGYTLLKNSLSNQGILAISIGIVDPLYEGLMSSTLINFSRSPITLRSGDAFLRVAFHEYSPNKDLHAPKLIPDSEYVDQRVHKVRRYFSRTFLDLETTVGTIAPAVFQRGFDQWRNALFFYIPALALLLTLLNFGVAAGTAYLNRFGANKDQIKVELRREMQQEDYLQLRKDVDDLRQQLQKTNQPIKSKPNGKP